MKKLITLSLIILAFSCSEEPKVKRKLESGKEYTREEIQDITNTVLPPDVPSCFNAQGMCVCCFSGSICSVYGPAPC